MIPGASYFRCHPTSDEKQGSCELHLTGSYTICRHPSVPTNVQTHASYCPHDTALDVALSELAQQRMMEIKQMKPEVMDVRDNWKFEHAAHVVTFHGRDDKVLAMMNISWEMGPTKMYETASARLDRSCLPLVTDAKIGHCLKRGRIVTFFGFIAGEERQLHHQKYDGPDKVPLSEPLKTAASWYVDLSSLPSNFVLPAEPPKFSLCCIL